MEGHCVNFVNLESIMEKGKDITGGYRGKFPESPKKGQQIPMDKDDQEKKAKTKEINSLLKQLYSLRKGEASDDISLAADNAEQEQKYQELRARLNVFTASKLTAEERKAKIAEREKATKFYNGMQELNDLIDQYSALEAGLNGRHSLSGRILWRTILKKGWAVGVHVTPVKIRQTRVTVWDGDKKLTKVKSIKAIL